MSTANTAGSVSAAINTARAGITTVSQSVTPIRNALSIDIEEWFQTSPFQTSIPRDAWTKLSSGVEHDTDTILQLLAEHHAHATFFVLGWVAERHPELVRRIASAGHEIACRGYDRVNIEQMSPAVFGEDLICAKAILEDQCGEEVIGYRVPSGTLGAGTPWAYAVLAESGFRYSASSVPYRHAGYRRSERPAPFPNRASSGVFEIPEASLTLLRRRWPGPSGRMLRFLPYAASRWMVGRLNDTERASVVFNCASWEFDAQTPRIAGALSPARLGHYLGRSHMVGRFGRMLRDSHWERLDEVFRATLTGPVAAASARPAHEELTRSARGALRLV